MIGCNQNWIPSLISSSLFPSARRPPKSPRSNNPRNRKWMVWLQNRRIYRCCRVRAVRRVVWKCPAISSARLQRSLPKRGCVDGSSSWITSCSTAKGPSQPIGMCWSETFASARLSRSIHWKHKHAVSVSKSSTQSVPTFSRWDFEFFWNNLSPA